MGVKGTCLGNEGRKGGKMLKKGNMTHKKKMSGVADNSCLVKLCVNLDAAHLLGNTYI